MSRMNVVVVVGVGPGISKSVALKFSAEGYAVALIARRVWMS
jgi:NAD(P)-dependent dehydrogenase (short-subunit alcohol dehydrogenase family)